MHSPQPNSTPRCAQATPRLRMVARVRLCCGRVWSCRGLAPQPCCSPSCRVAAPCAPTLLCAWGCPCHVPPRAPRLPCAQRRRASAPRACAPACPPSLYCDTNCLSHVLFTTIHQSVLQYSAHQPNTWSQYNKLYCKTVS